MRLHETREITADVDRILRGLYDSRILEAEAIDPAYVALWQSIYRLTFAGGKRLRPYLTVLAYEIYGGRDYQGILTIAAAQELLHVSLLVHDDITDKDLIRHGVDNISGQYLKTYSARGASPVDARHYAESAALLAGDLLMSAAHGMVLQASLPDADKLAAHRILDASVRSVAAGQLLDMEAAMHDIQQTDAFKIARFKTASYSFVGTLRCGATLAGAPRADIERLAVLGDTLGLAFQLADDLLGVFGDEKATGKSVMTDLQEGKHTYLMQLTYSKADAGQSAQLERYFGRHDLSESQAGVVRDVIIACGAKSAVEAKLEACRQEADHQVGLLQIPGDAQSRVRRMVTTITKRDR